MRLKDQKTGDPITIAGLIGLVIFQWQHKWRTVKANAAPHTLAPPDSDEIVHLLPFTPNRESIPIAKDVKGVGVAPMTVNEKERRGVE